MASAGEISIKIDAKIEKFKAQMIAAKAATKKFERQAVRSAKRVGDAFKRLGRVISKALGVIKVFFVALTAGFLSMAKSVQMLNNFTKIGREIDNWSTTLKISTTDLQRFAAAALTVNFSFEKVTDILKDVSDKIGDFVATGGGEAKDLFARLGLGKLALAGQDPVKALSMIVDQMERLGNVSNQEKVFLFEAIANDTSKLIPILANGGKLLKQFGDEAEKAGAIITPDELKRLAKFQSISRVIGMQWKGIKKVFALELLPSITKLAAKIKEAFSTGKAQALAKTVAGKLVTAFNTLKDAMPTIISGFKAMGTILKTLVGPLELIASVFEKAYALAAKTTNLVSGGGLGNVIPGGLNAGTGVGHRSVDKTAPKKDPVKEAVKKAGKGTLVRITGEKGPNGEAAKFIERFIAPVATFAQSAEQFKAAVTVWQKGQDKANAFIADPTKASYAQGVIDRGTRDPVQAQDNRFDRIANSIRRDARGIQDEGGTIKPKEFQDRIQDLVNLSERVRGGNTTNTGMKDVIATLRNLGKAKPKEDVAKVEIKIGVDEGLITKFINQNPTAIRMQVDQVIRQAVAKKSQNNS